MLYLLICDLLKTDCSLVLNTVIFVRILIKIAFWLWYIVWRNLFKYSPNSVFNSYLDNVRRQKPLNWVSTVYCNQIYCAIDRGGYDDTWIPEINEEINEEIICWADSNCEYRLLKMFYLYKWANRKSKFNLVTLTQFEPWPHSKTDL